MHEVDDYTLPQPPYVALYGSHAKVWRRMCLQQLKAAQIPVFNTTHAAWDTISDDNGDEHQCTIDRLVAWQQAALAQATCVIVHLDWAEPFHNPKTNTTSGLSLATRSEIGFIAGRKIPAFVVIDPRVQGHNYLYAFCRAAESIVHCRSLEQALTKAVACFRNIVPALP